MDLLLNEKGLLDFTSGSLKTTGDLPQKVSQRLFINLRSNKGYWFMDKSYGVDWVNGVFGKRKSKNVIDTLLQNVVYGDKYVTEIVSWESSVDKRSYSCKFTVKISQLQESYVSINLIANESGMVLQDSAGSQYQISI